MTVFSYQDDFSLLVGGPKGALDFNKAVLRVLEKELGLILRSKPGSSQTFIRVAELIGARFDSTSPARPTGRTTPKLLPSVESEVQDLEETAGTLLELETAMNADGRLQCVSELVLGGRFYLNALYRCIAASAVV